MRKNNPILPTFKSVAEEAAFWDSHSVADYWHHLPAIDLVAELSKPKEETLLLRVHKDTKDKLTKVAKSKGLTVSSLARLWLTEKLSGV